jgi:hypothetical protein
MNTSCRTVITTCVVDICLSVVQAPQAEATLGTKMAGIPGAFFCPWCRFSEAEAALDAKMAAIRDLTAHYQAGVARLWDEYKQIYMRLEPAKKVMLHGL